MRGYVFLDKGQSFLVRCPACERENYAPAVATGVCAWCGYDANPVTLPYDSPDPRYTVDPIHKPEETGTKRNDA